MEILRMKAFGLFAAAGIATAGGGAAHAGWVRPDIGCGGDGHTFPGATYPFGLVQPSPDTGREGS